MVRLIALAVALFLLAAGCAGRPKGLAERVDREAALPAEFVGELAGAPVRLARDERDDGRNCLRWAWEEEAGEPLLLYVEAWLAPADCDTLYAAASGGAEALAAPDGVTACYDGRSAHMLMDGCYVRLASLGFTDEMEAYKRLAERLSKGLTH